MPSHYWARSYENSTLKLRPPKLSIFNQVMYCCVLKLYFLNTLKKIRVKKVLTILFFLVNFFSPTSDTVTSLIKLSFLQSSWIADSEMIGRPLVVIVGCSQQSNKTPSISTLLIMAMFFCPGNHWTSCSTNGSICVSSWRQAAILWNKVRSQTAKWLVEGTALWRALCAFDSCKVCGRGGGGGGGPRAFYKKF